MTAERDPVLEYLRATVGDPDGVDPEGAHCAACNRRIIWTVTASGARMPVDARAVTVYHLDPAPPTPAELLAFKALQAQPVYVSHFLTCPDAANFAKRAPRP